MSLGLIHKFANCIDGNDDDAAAGGAITQPALVIDRVSGQTVTSTVETLTDEVPAVMENFEDLLIAQGQLDARDPQAHLGYVRAHAHFEISETAVRRGLVSVDQPMSVQITGDLRHQMPIDFTFKTGAPYALAVVLASYDATGIPFDTQLSIGGMRLLEANGASHTCLRDFILQAGSLWPRGTPQTLLTRAFTCEDPITHVKFGSVEAIGFNAKYLRDNILELVDESEQPEYTRRLAQLFGARQSTVGTVGLFDNAGGSGGAASFDAASQHSPLRRFYLMPVIYEYTSLLVRVHVYLTMRALRLSRAHGLPHQQIDMSLYELPQLSKKIVFPAAEMDEVIDFVNVYLVGVHPIFDPSSISAHLAPIEHKNWADAWNTCVPDGDKKIECGVTLLIYYAMFNRGTSAGDYQRQLRLDECRVSRESQQRITASALSKPFYGIESTTDGELTDGDESSAVFEPAPLLSAKGSTTSSSESATTGMSSVVKNPFPLDIQTPRHNGSSGTPPHTVHWPNVLPNTPPRAENNSETLVDAEAQQQQYTTSKEPLTMDLGTLMFPIEHVD